MVRISQLGALLLGPLLSLSHLAHAIVVTEPLKNHRDVVVIGGGSAGLHAAVRLKQQGRRVIVLEKHIRFGGHTNTYPLKDGKTFDYGTQILVNVSFVQDFFNSLNVRLAPALPPNNNKIAVDIFHETRGPTGPTVDHAALEDALHRYQTILDKYPASMFRSFDLGTNPQYDDLVLPWGDFLAKYKLEALAFDGWLQFQGMGNLLGKPTLYVMKLFSPLQVRARLQNLRVRQADHNMQSLWDAAQAYLGDDAVGGATITSIRRYPTNVTVTYETDEGVKEISGFELLITVPPKGDILKTLDLTAEESDLFSKFSNSYYYNAVVGDTNFPSNATIYNYDNTGRYHIPTMPAVYSFTEEPEDLWATQYSSATEMAADAVMADIRTSVIKARKALGLPDYPPDKGPTIYAFNDHSPFGFTVSVDDIRSGYYSRLMKLRGASRTFWSGHAFCLGSSTTIWDYNDHDLLPAINEALLLETSL